MAETLAQAIQRMRKQHYTNAQIEGQIKKWHPTESRAQIVSQVDHAESQGSAPPPRRPVSPAHTSTPTQLQQQPPAAPLRTQPPPTARATVGGNRAAGGMFQIGSNKDPFAHTNRTSALPAHAHTAATTTHYSANCTPIIHKQHGGFLGGLEHDLSAGTSGVTRAAGYAVDGAGHLADEGYHWAKGRTLGDYLKIVGGANIIVIGTAAGGYLIVGGAAEAGIGAAAEPEDGPLGVAAVGFGFHTVGVGATLLGASLVAGGGLIESGLRSHPRHNPQ